MSYLWGITIRAPHGGVFVVLAMNKVLPFFICLIVAGAVSAALIVLVSKNENGRRISSRVNKIKTKQEK